MVVSSLVPDVFQGLFLSCDVNFTKQLLILLIFSKNAYCQSDSLDYYFDDGGLSNTNNIVKLNCTGIFYGDYTMSFERKINSFLTIEAGLGLWNGKLIFNAEYPVNIRMPIPKPTITYFFQPRFYYRFKEEGNALEFMYSSFMYRKRKADLRSDSLSNYQMINFTDFFYTTGYQGYIGKRLTFDASFGFGFTFNNYTTKNQLYGELVGTLYFLNLKMGMRF